MSNVPEELYVETYPIIITGINELESTFDYQFYLGYWYEIGGDMPYCFFESKNLEEAHILLIPYDINYYFDNDSQLNYSEF